MTKRIQATPKRVKAFENICGFVERMINNWEKHTLEFHDFTLYYRYELPAVSRIYRPWVFWKPEDIVKEALICWDNLIADMGDSCMGCAPSKPITPERIAEARAHIDVLREIEVSEEG
jgi:hypothetical protein